MAQPIPSPNPDPLSADVSPLEHGVASSHVHHSGPAEPDNVTPASYPQPCQDDRKRTRETEWPRQEATRSDLTVSRNHNSGLERESTLQNIQTMDTSSNMGNSARVDGGYGMPVSLSHADQCAEGTSSHAPPQCKKVPIYCPGTDGWAWLQSWRSPVSEPPMLDVERTVPRTSENPRPNARPIPGPPPPSALRPCAADRSRTRTCSCRRHRPAHCRSPSRCSAL